ncbi:MAG: hypothetical protein FE834_01125 [Gammaproteobacteria bacterium]|nr:hypothetical protein [Gammaproteobacteria bacterium]
MSKMSVVVVSLALLVGCGVKPIKNINSATIYNKTSIENIEKAIVRAGVGLGWVMNKKSDGRIVGKLALRKHLAIVNITYDQNSYSINYVSSSNLDYANGKIHGNYNGWITNLEHAINSQLSLF